MSRCPVPLTQPAAFFPFGEVLETVGGSPLGLLVFFHVPGQLSGNVGDEEAAGAKAVVMPPHAELTVLQEREEGRRVRLVRKAPSSPGQRTPTKKPCTRAAGQENSPVPQFP